MSGFAGKRIVVTRAKHQAKDLVGKIEALGGIAVEYPCIDIAPPDDLQLLDTVLGKIADYDWVLFTSRNTVRMIAKRLQESGLHINWEQIKVGAVGTKTEALIQDLLGKSADFIPDNYTAKDLAHNLPVLPYEKVLLPQSSLADNDMYEILLGERQADVTLVIAYQTVIGQGGDHVLTMLENGQIDAITFTSPSTVENFVTRISPKEVSDIPVVCIGSVTAKSAQDNGFLHVYHPQEHTIDHLLKLLEKLFTEASHDKS